MLKFWLVPLGRFRLIAYFVAYLYFNTHLAGSVFGVFSWDMLCRATLLPWINWYLSPIHAYTFVFFQILFTYFIILKNSRLPMAMKKCLQPVQVTSMTYVCSHPIWYNVFHTMLYNCIYEIIQCCSPPLSTLSIKVYNVAKNSTSYSTIGW